MRSLSGSLHTYGAGYGDGEVRARVSVRVYVGVGLGFKARFGSVKLRSRLGKVEVRVVVRVAHLNPRHMRVVSIARRNNRQDQQRLVPSPIFKSPIAITTAAWLWMVGGGWWVVGGGWWMVAGE